MPRAKAILQNEFPYNISARCINREWFSLSLHNVWEIFCEELTETSKNYNFQIHSFVLMSNHYHLIASTPDANISQCMHRFMTKTSKRLTRAGNRINETFAGRHYKCILQQVLGFSAPVVPLVEDSTFMNDPEGILKWLNTSSDSEKLEALRVGLKRQYFKSKKCRVTNKSIIDENDIL